MAFMERAIRKKGLDGLFFSIILWIKIVSIREGLKAMPAPSHETHWIIIQNVAKRSHLLCSVKLVSITKYVARAIAKGITCSA